MHWLSRLFRKNQAEKELDSELRFHVERRVADFIAGGMSSEEARRRARLEFGANEGIKEDCREARRGNVIEAFVQDLRFALRLLRKNLGFTLTAIVTLALGIGANTAIFSIVNASILRPLPYKDSRRMVRVYTKTAMFPTFNLGLSWIAFQQIRTQARSLEESAVYSEAEKAVTGQGDPAVLTVANVSDGFFEELGATPQIGRLLGDQDLKPGQNQVAVLSDVIWRTRFGADPSVLGRTLILDKNPYTVVGVLPSRFMFPERPMSGYRWPCLTKTKSTPRFSCSSFSESSATTGRAIN